MLCSHKPQDHFPNEISIRAHDVKPGDKLSYAGALAIVLNSSAADLGWTHLFLDILDEPLAVENEFVIHVRRDGACTICGPDNKCEFPHRPDAICTRCSQPHADHTNTQGAACRSFTIAYEPPDS
ncbi:hypothetical protein [Streptomyces sp. NPDC037389]|uniref:hypothetical protein n=1 Tax=Streptomyces sp. NPDC037389 TaxID=3155369 RepID=UPI0033D50CCB